MQLRRRGLMPHSACLSKKKKLSLLPPKKTFKVYKLCLQRERQQRRGASAYCRGPIPHTGHFRKYTVLDTIYDWSQWKCSTLLPGFYTWAVILMASLPKVAVLLALHFLFSLGTMRQRQTGLLVSYRKYRYQGSWYQYRSRSRHFLSLGISPGIDPEPWAFFGRFWQNSY